MKIILTSYRDAVKAELDNGWGCKVVGWFIDEPDALVAVAEHIMLQSAILPELRKLPELIVTAEYRISKCGKEIDPFIRATQSRAGEMGRRLVLRPMGAQREWVPTERTD